MEQTTVQLNRSDQISVGASNTSTVLLRYLNRDTNPFHLLFQEPNFPRIRVYPHEARDLLHSFYGHTLAVYGDTCSKAVGSAGVHMLSSIRALHRSDVFQISASAMSAHRVPTKSLLDFVQSAPQVATTRTTSALKMLLMNRSDKSAFTAVRSCRLLETDATKSSRCSDAVPRESVSPNLNTVQVHLIQTVTDFTPSCLVLAMPTTSSVTAGCLVA